MHDTVRRLREKRRGEEGFTLIELLVVVVIIGILVAIAVPVYLNYRQGAADKSAQSDVRGAISAIEQYYTDNGNRYPATSTRRTTPRPTQP
jgi:type IV pilus assembly protein PilA